MICALSTKNGVSSYFPEGTQVSKYGFGNAYYHLNSSCVKFYHPQIVSYHHLQIPTDLNLSQAHKEILQTFPFLTDALARL